MRICLVSSSFYPATFYGGPISATWDLSKEIARNNIEVYVSTTNANGFKQLNVNTNKFIKKKENLQVKYYNEQIINKFSIAFIFGIWSDLKKANIVYIQYLFHYTVLFSLVFSAIQNKRIIICPRGSFSQFTLSNKLAFIKSIWITIFIKPFIKNTKWQASSYLEKADIKREFPKAKITIVNDGVDFNAFQDAVILPKTDLVNKYTNKSFDKVSTVFFSMGRLHKIKGFDVIIDAFALFLKEHPNSKLLIAGADDGVQLELENQIKKLDLSESVFLIGMVNHEQKCELLSSCTAFALASEFESFGIVIAEALACGCPVIASNKTPWKELEINNCGILAENQKRDFYKAFIRIIAKKYNKNQIKEYVKSRYDLKIITKGFINIFK